MNYGIRPHRVLLCPQINLSDLPPTVRMNFLLNDFMGKNYSYKFEANSSCYEDLLPYLMLIHRPSPSYQMLRPQWVTHWGFLLYLLFSSAHGEISWTIKVKKLVILINGRWAKLKICFKQICDYGINFVIVSMLLP